MRVEEQKRRNDRSCRGNTALYYIYKYLHTFMHIFMHIWIVLVMREIDIGRSNVFMNNDECYNILQCVF